MHVTYMTCYTYVGILTPWRGGGEGIGVRCMSIMCTDWIARDCLRSPACAMLQEIRNTKDDGALPSAAKGRNLHPVGDKIPKVRRLLKVRRRLQEKGRGPSEGGEGREARGGNNGLGEALFHMVPQTLQRANLGPLLCIHTLCLMLWWGWCRATSARCTRCTGPATACNSSRRRRTASSSSGTPSPPTRTRCVSPSLFSLHSRQIVGLVVSMPFPLFASMPLSIGRGCGKRTPLIVDMMFYPYPTPVEVWPYT